jgi:putative membrane protein
MAAALVDVLVVLSWAVVPSVAVVVARRRLRRAGSRAIGMPSVAAAILGFVALGVAVMPSVGSAAERTFAGHMAQHLVLGLAAPLLLVAGRTSELLPWLLPLDRRRELRRVAGPLAHPTRSVVAPTAVMIAVWYAWHLPSLYGAAVGAPVVHVLEHTTIVASGWWFWSAVAPHRRRLGSSVVALFAATLSLGFLGGVLSLSPEPFYGKYVAAETVPGQLDDQHLGGLLMWTPGGLVYLLAMVVQLIRWFDLDGGAAATAVAPDARPIR